MLLPGALVTFLPILFSLGLVLFLAFRGNDGSLLGAGFTVANFATVVSDPLYWTVTLRSLVIAALVTLATVVTAYPVAYYLAFHAGRRRGLLLFRFDAETVPLAEELGAVFCNPSVADVLGGAETMAALARAGVGVMPWTPNDMTQWPALVAAGAAGLITDHVGELTGWATAAG